MTTRIVVFPLYTQYNSIDFVPYSRDKIFQYMPSHFDIYKIFNLLADNYDRHIFHLCFQELIRIEENRLDTIRDQCQHKDIQAFQEYYEKYKCLVSEQSLNKICPLFIDEGTFENIGVNVAYQDVFAVDLSLSRAEQPINVVMVLHNGQYYGHVYAWNIEEYVFFIGIRSRVDNLWFRQCNQSIDKIASYLIEGVRQFAISKNALWLIVYNPIGKMPSILRNIGFQRFQTSSIFSDYEYSDCSDPIFSNCYGYKISNVQNSFVNPVIPVDIVIL